MKQFSRILSIAALLFVGALTFGCISLEISGLAGDDEIQAEAVTMTTTICLDSSSDTKALTADGVKTFAPGERITVFYVGDYIRRAVSEELSAGDISSDGKKATFTVTLINPTSNETLRYIYPADMAMSTYDNDYLAIDDANTIDFGRLNSQDGSLKSLANRLDLAVYHGHLSASGELPSSAKLENRLCIGEFNIKYGGGTIINDKLVHLTVSDGTNSYTVNRSASADPFYIAMLPVENKTVSISASDGQNYYIKQVNGVSLAGNTIYPINVTVTPTDDRSTPLTFEAIADGTVTFTTNSPSVTVQYRKGEGAWTNYSAAISLAAGERVSFRGNNATYSPEGYNSYFSCSADCYLYGNIMSLVNAVEYASVISLTGDNAFYSLFRDNEHIFSHASKPLLLPATVLTENCYANMFIGCSGLTTAPDLPAIELKKDCYANMFKGCASLTTAPALPATMLTDGCYFGMFQNCTSLSTAPELPAEVMTDSCYGAMFRSCTSLSVAPALPATTLAIFCYMDMFNGCYSLCAAPALPATTLADCCYQDMFSNCVNLYAAPELPATTLAEYCYESLFQGCTGLSSAPDLPATTLAEGCYESMFGTCLGLVTAPALPAATLAEGCYSEMFRECSDLTAAPDLPATELAEYCYANMFTGCSGLTTAPDLPATTMTEFCYKNMFSGCTSLSTAPALPATTLAKGCYESMFCSCEGLVTAPALPATELAEGCYADMFKDCIRLTTAPNLSALTLVKDCYDQMFFNCRKLNSLACLAVENISGNTDYWLDSVAKTGAFSTYDPNLWSRDTSGIPVGWDVYSIPIIITP